MKNVLLILFVLVILGIYGVKIYQNVKMLHADLINFDTSIQCTQDIQNGKTGVCD